MGHMTLASVLSHHHGDEDRLHRFSSLNTTKILLASSSPFTCVCSSKWRRRSCDPPGSSSGGCRGSETFPGCLGHNQTAAWTTLGRLREGKKYSVTPGSPSCHCFTFIAVPSLMFVSQWTDVSVMCSEVGGKQSIRQRNLFSQWFLALRRTGCDEEGQRSRTFLVQVVSGYRKDKRSRWSFRVKELILTHSTLSAADNKRTTSSNQDHYSE